MPSAAKRPVILGAQYMSAGDAPTVSAAATTRANWPVL